MSEEFWDKTWSEFQPFRMDPDVWLASRNASERAFLLTAGDVEGKLLLDLGCGNGELSVYFALRGARVTAVDNSETGIANAQHLAELNGVSIRALKLDAGDIAQLGQEYDLVVGRFILHHLEPFHAFVQVLRQVLRAGGRALFLENSANNRLLIFFRDSLTGRFGIPKYGDREEHPLQAEEIQMMERAFPSVRVHYPEFLFFRMLGAYVFKGRPAWMKFFLGLDNRVYNWFPRLRKYSYYQVIEIRSAP